jgi:hypothetical protein
MDYEPTYYQEVIENPYGPGTLYDTGMIARIMPDGTVDFLKSLGQEIVIDGARGRLFIDLAVTRDALQAYPGIAAEETYLKYNPEAGEMCVYADITLEKDKAEGFDKAACLEALKEKLPANHVPLDLYGV